jgi:hypothetical protein
MVDYVFDLAFCLLVWVKNLFNFNITTNYFKIWLININRFTTPLPRRLYTEILCNEGDDGTYVR